MLGYDDACFFGQGILYSRLTSSVRLGTFSDTQLHCRVYPILYPKGERNGSDADGINWIKSYFSVPKKCEHIIRCAS